MKRYYLNLVLVFLLLTFTVSLLGCGGGSSSSTPPAAGGGSISGSVAAPNGSIAYNWHNSLRRMFARFFVSEARAGSPSLPGVSSVGAGVTVSLIQIDNNGNQVGAAIATATTDASGNYTLTTPVGFTPGPNYVVVASSGGTSIRSFATGTSVDVNPYSHTTVALITGTVSGASGQITNVSIADIDAVQQTVLQTSGDVSTTSTTATALTTALQAA